MPPPFSQTELISLWPYVDPARVREILGQVNQAALDRRTLEMAYQSLSGARETTSQVDPYNISYQNGSYYLIAHCRLRGEVRIFVLDRIRLARVTERCFTIPEDFDLDEYPSHLSNILRGETHKVRILISPQWARYVAERVWHESQRVTWHDNGSGELSSEGAGSTEIRMRV